jgi:hypothetical protein
LTVVLDDHLLRDWLAGPDRALRRAVRDEPVATTNLWYVRLCKSAASARGGALLGNWTVAERRALARALTALPSDITVLPMQPLAWRIGSLVADHSGLSTLGAEAVAAAEALEGRLLVSSRDDGPGIRQACAAVGIRYTALART